MGTAQPPGSALSNAAPDPKEKMAEIEGPEERIELISPELCGSLGIHLSVVTLAPGVHDRPHWHVQGEKVMYVSQGRGAILVGAWAQGAGATTLAIVSVALATVNVVGGFVVTDRMLKMFKARPAADRAPGAKAHEEKKERPS